MRDFGRTEPLAWLTKHRLRRSSVSSSANRFRRASRITSACLASRAWRCSPPTRCRRSRTRPTSSSSRSRSPGHRRSATRFRSASSSRRSWPSSPSPIGRRFTPTRPAAAPTSSRRRTSAPTPGLIAAASLLVDYTLTVVGQHFGRRPRDHVGVPAPRCVPRRDVPRVSGDPHGRQPARHSRVGTASSRCRPTSSSVSIFVLIARRPVSATSPAASCR